MTLEAKEFQMKEPSGRALAGFQRLYINFQLSSLFRWALTFAEVDVDAPSVNLVIDADGKVNLARLAGPDTAPAPAKKESKPIRLMMSNIQINQGRIDVTDNRQATPAGISFSPLNIHLADISTLPDRAGPYTLTATGTGGATLTWSGQVSLQPLRSEGNLGFENVSLSALWKFYRSSLNIAYPEGKLDVTTHYFFDYSKDRPVVTLDGLNLNVRDVGLQMEGAEKAFLKLSEIKLDAGALDLMQQKIDNVRFAAMGGALDLVMGKDGVLNVQRLIKQNTETKTRAPQSSTPNENQAPWVINIPEVKLENLAIAYTDQSRANAVAYSIDDLKLAFKMAVNTDAPGMQVQVDELGLALQKIAIGYADGSKPALQAGSLAVSGGGFDLAGRSASVSRVEVKDGSIDVTREKNNTINLARLFASDKPAQKESAGEAQAAAGEPWQYVVENISLSGFKTQISDLTVKPDSQLINIEDIRMSASHFDGKSPFPFEMGLHVVQGGDVSASGTLDPTSLALKSAIKIKDLALPVVQPYLSQTASDLTLNSGRCYASGVFVRNGKGGMSYKGQVGIADLKITENSTRDTLLGWEELSTPEMRFSTDPDGLEMDTLKLNGLECKLIISEDKKVNMVEAFKTKSEPSTEPQTRESAPVTSAQKPGGAFPVKIARLSIEKGKMDFTDLSLTPQFAAKIHELNGVIIGISSTPGARTQVELAGRVDEYGSNKITGEINVFDPKQFTDISMVFKNVDMTTLTPYSGKFAGYKIDYGKLSLDLQYKIQNSKLLGENKIVVDSLKLGEKVESPDAVHLPLKLAVAILKDSNGVIDIGLPVSGDLNDPDFHYGGLIWKALVNLLTKLVTAPFKALGSLFGGSGEETLDAVNFDAGSSVIPPPEEEKLAKLLEALQKRPQLKLIITGRYSNDADGQAIKELQVRRALAEKDGMTLAPGENPGPVDFSNARSQQKLTAMFVERYGQEAYDTLNPGTKPVDKKAKAKKARAKQADMQQAPEDPGEIAKRIYAELIKREQVDQAVLKQLADNRAQAVVNYLTSPDRLAAERVTAKPSESTSAKDAITTVLGLDAMD
jgi:uncharacterized protein involved in outer membrane biogenesis